MNKNRFSKLFSTEPIKACLLISAVLAVAATGCSSVKTHVDAGAIKARTFSFLRTGSRQPSAAVDNSAQAHALIQQALVNNLAAKGISKVPSGGDVTVAYLLIVGNNVGTASLNEYFG